MGHSLRLRTLLVLAALVAIMTTLSAFYNLRQLEAATIRALEHEGHLLADALTAGITSAAELENVTALQARVDRLAAARAHQIEVNIALLRGDNSFTVASNNPENVEKTSEQEHAELLTTLTQSAPVIYISREPLATETPRAPEFPTPTPLPAGASLPPTIPDGERFLSFTAPLEVEGKRVGSIEVVMSLADLDRQLDDDRRNYVLVAGVGTLLTLLLFGLLLDFQLLRPLARLSESMQRVAGGDLHQRLPAERRDEIGTLASTFNGMAEQLLRARVQLHQYLNPLAIEEANRRAETPGAEPLAEKRELTILFADIVSFTPLAEQLGPERTVAFLNRYYDLIAGALVDSGGRIDKFVADEVVCLFDGQAHAARAVAAAREILRRLALTTMAERAQVRIGLNTGYCIVADIGSQAIGRLDRTVIGDAVNVGQRLMTEAEPNSALLSAETKQQLRHAAPDIQPVAPLRLKGKTAAVSAYELRILSAPFLAQANELV